MDDDDSPFEGIENLLNLHNYAGEVGGDHRVFIKAFMVPPHIGQPHGLNYSLTLHTPGDSRLVGYDNAHGPRPYSGPAKRSRRRLLCWDHRHWRDRTYAYDFVSAGQLVEDFWADVYKMLKEEGVP
jgi:Family of unknown function (DUF6516)